VEHPQVQALEQAHQSRWLVLGGLVDDRHRSMGVYALREGGGGG
jgi:hypothetical protein